jgi:hypothetical protein
MKAPIYFVTYVTPAENGARFPHNVILEGITPLDWLATKDTLYITILFWAEITNMAAVPDNIFKVVDQLKA